MQHPSALLVDELVEHLGHVSEVVVDDADAGQRLLGRDRARAARREPGHERVAA